MYVLYTTTAFSVTLKEMRNMLQQMLVSDVCDMVACVPMGVKVCVRLASYLS
jgi:hypothetical protein